MFKGRDFDLKVRKVKKVKITGFGAGVVEDPLLPPDHEDGVER